MAAPRRNSSFLRGFSPLAWLLLLLALLTAGVAAYASTEPPLDWSAGAEPDFARKMQGMIASRTLSMTIDEAELNALIKSALYERRRLSEQAELTGADAKLSGDTLIVRTDVTIAGRLRLPLTHTLRLEWEKPDVKATHLSSALKDVSLPASLFPIGVIRVPLAFDERLPAELDAVTFEEDALRLTFRLVNPIH